MIYIQLHCLLPSFLCLLGRSPNSTGGGVKISTIAVAFLAARTLFNNRPDTEVLNVVFR